MINRLAFALQKVIFCYKMIFFVCGCGGALTIDGPEPPMAGPFLILYACALDLRYSFIYPWPGCCWAGSRRLPMDPSRRKAATSLGLHNRSGERNTVPNTKTQSQARAGHSVAIWRVVSSVISAARLCGLTLRLWILARF
jgi:hypothetical protein